MYYRSKKTRVK